MMGGMMGGWGGAWPGLGWIGMVITPVLWIAVLAVIVWGVTQIFPAGRKDERESALDILKRRYASGEITQAEFEQARSALS